MIKHEWDKNRRRGSVSIDGDVAVIGSDDGEGGYKTGAAYVYEFDGTVWQERAKLKASDAAVGDWFGTAAAVSGDMVLLGAILDDDGGDHSGAAYVFSMTGACNP